MCSSIPSYSIITLRIGTGLTLLDMLMSRRLKRTACWDTVSMATSLLTGFGGQIAVDLVQHANGAIGWSEAWQGCTLALPRILGVGWKLLTYHIASNHPGILDFVCRTLAPIYLIIELSTSMQKGFPETDYRSREDCIRHRQDRQHDG